MFIELPSNVKKIIETLESAGFEAYAVGGCVRDSILGRTPNDWDITTSANPLETKALFKRTFDTGIKHGTISVLIDKEIYEVTTFRIDGEYEDSRHPKEVTFTRELKEDLLRRDFTINAMAYNERVGLVDMYNGLDDLNNKVIRCVGKAEDRFNEDALRIMRAVRFAAQLEFDIESETKAAIIKLAPTLEKISAERIQVELVKMLVSNHPEYIKVAYELGITKVILPEFDVMMETEQNNPNHCYTVGEHTVVALKETEPDKVLRLATLMHDIGKPAAKVSLPEKDSFKGHPLISAEISHKIFKRLKFDNDTENKVCRLVLHHDWQIGAVPNHMRRYINRIGEEAFPVMFELNRADILAQSELNRNDKLAHLEKLREAYNEIIEKQQCVSLKTLAVKGRDLIEAGVEAGPKLGEELGRLLEIVLDDPGKNDKEYLLSLVNK